MSAPGLTVTAFPVPGYNFRCPDGKVRGVDQVECSTDGIIVVTFIDGYDETWEPGKVQEVEQR